MKRHLFAAAVGIITATATLYSVTLTAAPADRMMNKLDTNEDGVVSFEEFQTPPAKMIKKMDTNGDGGVSLAEMRESAETKSAEKMARMEERHEQVMAHLEERFLASDENGDGLVTSDEARRHAFKKIDTDGDGSLSAEEIAQARPDHKKHKGHHSDNGPGH